MHLKLTGQCLAQNVYHCYYVAVTAASTVTNTPANIGLPKWLSGKESPLVQETQ